CGASVPCAARLRVSGAMTMRLGNVRSPSLKGAKSAAASRLMKFPFVRTMTTRASGRKRQEPGAPAAQTKNQPRADRVPGERADGALARPRFAHENFSGVGKA